MTTSGRGTPTGGLVQSLQGNAASLVRLELDRLRQELSDSARQAGRASALLGGAGLLGMVTVGTSVALVLRSLDTVLPRPASAALLSGVCGAGAGVLAALGVAELRRARPFVPEETVQGVTDDVRAARPGTSGGTARPAG
ncbi:phage holin family protein [Modestobacter sp. VKM Ac-2985]|uniref:phage holin family protein n=1 Tax=Modestobacter sp. VKM Ac-2985 TaxID=3004139 RepID=UPI0022ABC1FC|nr:phage holin family protein [Modestobacter sp. VKM Ac-2985]MCZ2837389.1 phage holin family protein [Modestobacter sp. VKM Ac-2985]